jgi:hypothetical protein
LASRNHYILSESNPSAAGVDAPARASFARVPSKRIHVSVLAALDLAKIFMETGNQTAIFASAVTVEQSILTLNCYTNCSIEFIRLFYLG